jgi:catechol 2,3-dioxygenase-like lactoylglutathione lyase family enzyme
MKTLRFSLAALYAAAVSITEAALVNRNTALGPGPSIGAFALGVSNLTRSTAFWTDIVGMTQIQRFDVSAWNETVLAFPGTTGVSMTLFHFPDTTHTYTGLPVRVVLYVDDPQSFVDKVAGNGGKVVVPYAPSKDIGGLDVAIATDPDGYMLEIYPTSYRASITQQLLPSQGVPSVLSSPAPGPGVPWKGPEPARKPAKPKKSLGDAIKGLGTSTASWLRGKRHKGIETSVQAIPYEMVPEPPGSR